MSVPAGGRAGGSGSGRGGAGSGPVGNGGASAQSDGGAAGASSSAGGTIGEGGSGYAGESAAGAGGSEPEESAPLVFECGLPAPGVGGLPKPSGAVGNLRVLDWAGFKAATTYTFDDTNSSQIANYPALKALGVPMTFFLQTNKPAAADATWAQAVLDGHELGNHTKNHPYTGTDAEVDDATAFIEQHFHVKVWTMAAPYGDSSYNKLAESRFLANRGVAGGYVSVNGGSNPFQLPCYIPAQNALASAMNSVLDAARNAKAWQIVLVHGFGGDGYQPVAIGEFTSSVNHTKSWGDVWIDSMVQVAAYWRAQKMFSSIVPTVSGTDRTWTWTLPAHFPPGRCLRVNLDGGSLEQPGGRLVWNDHGYYEVSLDQGSLTLSAAPHSGSPGSGGAGGNPSATGGAASAMGGTSSAKGGAGSAMGGTNSAKGGTSSAAGGTSSAAGGASSGAGGTSSAAGGTSSATGGTSSGVGGSGAGGISSAMGGTSSAEGGTNPAMGGTSSAEGGTNPAMGGTSSAEGGTSSAMGGTSSAEGGTLATEGGTNSGGSPSPTISGVMMLSVPLSASGEAQQFNLYHISPTVDLSGATVTARIYAPAATSGQINVWFTSGDNATGDGLVQQFSEFNAGFTDITIPVPAADGSFDPSVVNVVHIDVMATSSGPWQDPTTIVYLDGVVSSNGNLVDTFDTNPDADRFVQSQYQSVAGSSYEWLAEYR